MRCSSDSQGCPCGYLGHPEKDCRCTASALDRYRSRISGPLLDRIDVMIEVPPLSLDGIDRDGVGETSEVVRARVLTARAFRRRREKEMSDADAGRSLSGPCAGEYGSAMTALERNARVTTKARLLLRRALLSDGLSGRAFARTIRLARTIADLDQVEEADVEHIAEALSLRLDHRRAGFSR